MSRGWVKASACCLQVSLSCAVLCQIVSLPYLSRSAPHRLAGLPYPSVVFEAVQDHFIFVTLLIMSRCLFFTQMLIILALYVMLSILLSILVCAAASLFCACLVCFIWQWQHTGVVNRSLIIETNRCPKWQGFRSIGGDLDHSVAQYVVDCDWFWHV